MAIGVIELRSSAQSKTWYPGAVGNITTADGLTIRYPAYELKKKIDVGFRTLRFLKSGDASDTEKSRPQFIDNVNFFLARYGRACGAMPQSNRSWRAAQMYPSSLRLVKFDTLDELDVYLATKGIVSPVKARPKEVAQVILPQTTQTVAELYADLTKAMALDPNAANAVVVKCKAASQGQTLTDEEALQITKNIGAAMLKTAVDTAAASLENKANEEVARIYGELAPNKTAPTIKLSATVISSVPKAPVKKATK